MSFTTTKSAFWAGFRDGAPFLLVVGPFAFLFGVLATEAGLQVYESLAFSVAVIAGAAQFTALSLMQEQAPTLIVLASALAVNLRMAMYSASLTPYLGHAPLWQRIWASYFLVDQAYALAMTRFDADPQMPIARKMAYFFGTVLPVCPIWYIMTVVGALVGQRVPENWALDFIMPLAFLALIGPMLRTPAHVLAAFVGIVVALLAAGLPYNLGLVIAGVMGMVAGARAELWQEARRNA